ncbi:MAG: glycoside hydrolase family 3 N-terminal domain-containing protein [Pseudomonadota bacterium]
MHLPLLSTPSPVRAWRAGLPLCLFTALLMAWAWHLKDPRLLMLRDVEWPLLLALSAAGGLGAWALRPSPWRWLAVWGVSVTVALTAVGQLHHHHRQQWVLSQPPEVLALAPHFIVGYTDPAVIREWVAKGLIGGVFITARNVQGRSAEVLQAEIAELQTLNREAGRPPLIVSTDQEGGAVSRLSPPLPRQDTLASLARRAADDQALAAMAYEHGHQQGTALAALGVNVNFSPVVDLKVERGRHLLDFHTLISTRAISADPMQTALTARAYSLGLQQHGVLPTLKHFPGLGDVVDDTHYFSAQLLTDPQTLRERDWRPFRDVAASTQALIMLGHVVVPQIDAKAPASLSRALIQTVIRGEWQHEGALVTDDMTMGAVYNRGFCQAVPQALNAGVDLLLIAYDEDKFFDAMYCAARAARERQLDSGLLAQSRQRLKALRAHWPPPAKAPGADGRVANSAVSASSLR